MNTLLDKDKIVSVPWLRKKVVGRDMKLYRFQLPSPQHILGAPNGSHIMVRNDQGEEKEFTPITGDQDLGYFELLIKVWPESSGRGDISRYVDSLGEGNTMEIRGPFCNNIYEGDGLFTINGKSKRVSRVGMISEGSGLSPNIPLIRKVLGNENRKIELSLIYANKDEEDIAMREELEGLRDAHPDRFHLYYTLQNPPEGWSQGSGHVSESMIKECMPAPAQDIHIIMCGRWSAVKRHCEPILNSLGYSPDMWYAY